MNRVRGMTECDYCQHVEMCGWRKSLEERGCDFFDDGNKWIPVSERLPELRGTYLVTYHPCYWDDVQEDIKLVAVDTFKGKTTWGKNKFQRVIAWMPLPEPFELQEKEIRDGST